MSFFHPTATTAIYTLSLHDALPIYSNAMRTSNGDAKIIRTMPNDAAKKDEIIAMPSAVPPLPCLVNRSEEHTSELQSLRHLVCRLLLEKKKIKTSSILTST